MTEGAKTGRTIHVQRNQFHLAWDHSIPPLATIQSGEVVEFDLLDAAGGQIGPDSTVEAIDTLDFARVDQVNGPNKGSTSLFAGRSAGRAVLYGRWARGSGRW